MKIKLTGIKTSFEMENFEFSLGKKEIKRLAKRGRTEDEWDLRRENDELKKRLNDAHSQMGDLRKELDALRHDMRR